MNCEIQKTAPVLVTRVGSTFLLIAVPSREQSVARCERLSEAERAVVVLAARGLSNHRIAVERGTSVRTVAKQLGSAYLKLGLSGRRELGARLR